MREIIEGLDYKAMVTAIAELVDGDSDFVGEMEIDSMACEEFKPTSYQCYVMSQMLSQIYSIAHAVSCTPCSRKWVMPFKGDIDEMAKDFWETTYLSFHNRYKSRHEWVDPRQIKEGLSDES